jgi:hypothetical protein
VTEQELLLDYVRRLNSTGIAYMHTGFHKLYWNRITRSDRQLGDIAGVVHVQRGKLDEDYLRHWAAELGLASELETALSGAHKPKPTSRAFDTLGFG